MSATHQRIPRSVPRPHGVAGFETWQKAGALRRLWLKFHDLPPEDSPSELTFTEQRRAKFWLWRQKGKDPEFDV